MANIDLIGVPFGGYGRPGHLGVAAQVLRGHGLLDVLAGQEVDDRGDLDLPRPLGTRSDGTGLRNEPALLALAARLEDEVRGTHERGAIPLVVGGDCSALLGIVPALGPSTGLLFLDGHEDTMPLDVSEDGEAANVELGLLLGITGALATGDLARRRGSLDSSRLAVLGPRDASWRRPFNVASLRDSGVHLRDDRELREDPEGRARAALDHLHRATDSWWLHVDLDVLDPEQMPSQGIEGSSPREWCSDPSVSGVRLSVRGGHRCSPRSRGWWW